MVTAQEKSHKSSSPGIWKTEQTYTVKIKPHDQARVFLGDFSSDTIPAGFSVETRDQKELTDAIVTQVLSIQNENKTRLFMHIANFDSIGAILVIHKLSLLT